MENADQYPLHRAVFENDLERLAELLQQPPPEWNLVQEIARKDPHGNTALHLAVMLGRHECAQLLLSSDAPVSAKNFGGWDVLEEAVSYGDRPTITAVLRKLYEQSRQHIESDRDKMLRALLALKDFYMELKWELTSWVPLVTRVLPSDVFRVRKKGTSLRLDTTLIDFGDMGWVRGDLSFIFSGDLPYVDSLIMVNHDKMVYKYLEADGTEVDIEDEVDDLMSNDIRCVQLSTKGAEFSHSKTGWIFREDKTQMIGEYNCNLYSLQGLILKHLKRREHLSCNDAQQNKAIINSIFRGGDPSDVEEFKHRTSLPPPSPTNVTWEEYINAPEGECPQLGRHTIYKRNNHALRATIAMCEDFPISFEMLLQVLEVVASIKHIRKIREFINTKLPSGFPVRVEMPLMGTVSAKVTVQKFDFRDDIPETVFHVPANYLPFT